MDSERFSKNGTRSILHYTPVTEQVGYEIDNFYSFLLHSYSACTFSLTMMILIMHKNLTVAKIGKLLTFLPFLLLVLYRTLEHCRAGL